MFALVKWPELLWDCWPPSKSLDQYDLQELWACYSLGKPVFNVTQIQTGIKPPLQLMEEYFQSKWCGHSLGVSPLSLTCILRLECCLLRIGRDGSTFVRFQNEFCHNQTLVLYCQQSSLKTSIRCDAAPVTSQRRDSMLFQRKSKTFAS